MRRDFISSWILSFLHFLVAEPQDLSVASAISCCLLLLDCSVVSVWAASSSIWTCSSRSLLTSYSLIVSTSLMSSAIRLCSSCCWFALDCLIASTFSYFMRSWGIRLPIFLRIRDSAISCLQSPFQLADFRLQLRARLLVLVFLTWSFTLF